MGINLYRSGDTEEVLNYKVRLWEYMRPAPIIMGISGTIIWMLGLPLYAIGMWIFGFYGLILTALLIVLKRYEKTIATILLYFGLIFCIAATLLFGGILDSGGVVFVGLANAIFSVSFLSRRQTKLLFGIYVLFILLSPFLQPYLVPIEVIPPHINLFLFAAHILVIAFNVISVISQYMEESIQLKAKEAEQLKLLDGMKNKFYTNISHEFRTPLTVILGMAEQILKKPESLLVNGVNAIQKNGQRLLFLVNQMLDLAKLESGNLTLNFLQDDVIIFLKYIVEPFIHLGEEKDLHISISAPDHPVIMDFDSARLESIVANLMSNAIRHSTSGSDIKINIHSGKISLKASNYDFQLFADRTYDPNAEFLIITITDEGEGILKENIPLIFNRFQQEENSEITSTGTGIGLALVKDLLGLMKGQLYVKSNKGQGSKFSIVLPITNQAKRTNESYDKEIIKSEDPVFSDPTKSDHHLLIIEDNKDIADYITAVLQDEYKIQYASNGSEGIIKANTLLPDLIISDIMMPEKDGYEVCYTLKNDQKTSHIPIILLTAKADRESRLQGLEMGADAYLVKPFDSKELITILRNLWQLREMLQIKYNTLALTSVDIKLPENQNTWFIREVKQKIIEHLDDVDFDVNKLARMLNVSRTQLFRKIKALTGHSASELLRTIRLTRAKDLLINTDLNISEIGYEVGYKDPAYFSRAFTREFGCSPSYIRAQQNSYQ